MERDFPELFCLVDDFMKNLEKNITAINSIKIKIGIKGFLNNSEILTILIGYYQSSHDCFKNYYQQVILVYYKEDFKLVIYPNFIKLIGRHLPFLTGLLHQLFDKCSGLSFIDSTSIAVCKNYRFIHIRFLKELRSVAKLQKAGFMDLNYT